MKSMLISLACILICSHSNAQDVPGDSASVFISDASEKKEYKKLTEHFYASEYETVIHLADTLLQGKDSSIPADIYRYLAFSFYQVRNTKQAYQCMVMYMQKQDSSRISEYDLYLIAQFSARLKNKDNTALSILRKAYGMDTCLQNKKLYAAALVNHYLQTGSKYAATVWREKLLPLKELDRDDLYRISQAWYKFNKMGNVQEIFGQFASVYPNAFRSLYMHGEIQPEPGQ